MDDLAVHLVDDPMVQAYSVYLLDRRERRVLRADGRFGEPFDPSTTHIGDPTFRLPKSAAHALLGALARQLGAVEHPEQLRADYEAERARVDLFIGNLLERRR